MTKRLATVTGTAAVLAAALLVSDVAEAGGGATSAASKYRNADQVVTNLARTNRATARSDFPITEYSSSSVRTHAAKYR